MFRPEMARTVQGILPESFRLEERTAADMARDASEDCYTVRIRHRDSGGVAFVIVSGLETMQYDTESLEELVKRRTLAAMYTLFTDETKEDF
jgi:translation initiation factor 1 (eIF-1/SUI1)